MGLRKFIVVTMSMTSFATTGAHTGNFNGDTFTFSVSNNFCRLGALK